MTPALCAQRLLVLNSSENQPSWDWLRHACQAAQRWMMARFGVHRRPFRQFAALP